MLVFIFLLLACSLCSCNTKSTQTEASYRPIRDTIFIKDTLVILKETVPENKVQAVAQTPNPVKKIKAKKEEEKLIKPALPAPQKLKPEKYEESKDTQFYYYQNSKDISVKISPWNNGRRYFILYNAAGNSTYQMEEIKLSYQQSVTLHFHLNGAVQNANIHLNPGASMYWYETEISFDSNNMPQWRQQQQYPIMQLQLPQVEYWDKASNQWKKREVME